MIGIVGGLFDKIDKIMDLASERGTVQVLGRPVRYNSKAHWYRAEVVHKVEVVDEMSGQTAKADNNYSWHTSLRYALTELLQNLHDNGVLSGIPRSELKAVATAVTECVEDGGKCSYSRQLQDKLLEKTEAKPSPDLPPPPPPMLPPSEAPPPDITTSSVALPSQTDLPHPQTPGSFLDHYIAPENTTYVAVGVGGLVLTLSLVLYYLYGRNNRRPHTRYQSSYVSPSNTGSSGVLGHVLKESDLPVLQKLLVDEAYQSFSMGIQLGLPVGVVRSLQKDAPADIVQFQGLVLGRWLQCKDPPPTVEKLLEVLSGPVIQNKGLAENVKEHFGLS